MSHKEIEERVTVNLGAASNGERDPHGQKVSSIGEIISHVSSFQVNVEWGWRYPLRTWAGV